MLSSRQESAEFKMLCVNYFPPKFTASKLTLWLGEPYIFDWHRVVLSRIGRQSGLE